MSRGSEQLVIAGRALPLGREKWRRAGQGGNGLIQPFQQPERVVGFFNTYRQLYPVTRYTLRDIAEQFQRWVKERAAKLPRDNQGETAATIRMRMGRGWTDGARA